MKKRTSVSKKATRSARIGNAMMNMFSKPLRSMGKGNIFGSGGFRF